MTIEHKITERFYYTAFSVRFFYEIIAKHMVISEKVCKILLVLSLMLGVPQA